LSCVTFASGILNFSSEAILRKLTSLRREFASAAPTPLERLLVDRVAVG